jgi:peptidoglycan/xylan/chitin deacetylase (PgdA/CDA1 family)
MTDPQLLCVSPKNFAEQLDVLQKNYKPMRLQHLTQTFQDRFVPRRMVAVTFDDGYADNLYKAKPLLEHYEVPATVFVTTGYVGGRREFLWDELDRLLLQPGTLPEKLNLEINGKMHEWDLGSAAHYSKDVYQYHRSWNILDGANSGPRQNLYGSLCALLNSLPTEEIQRVLGDLRIWANTGPMGRLSHRILMDEEVSQLDASDFVEVGSHTVSHPNLSTLPVNIQQTEIKKSKQHLEDIVGHPVTTFSYPYGSQADYTAKTVKVVQESGFTCACSNFADVVWRGSDRFQLPRILVRNWDGDEFAAQLRRWLHG